MRLKSPITKRTSVKLACILNDFLIVVVKHVI